MLRYRTLIFSGCHQITVSTAAGRTASAERSAKPRGINNATKTARADVGLLFGFLREMIDLEILALSNRRTP